MPKPSNALKKLKPQERPDKPLDFLRPMFDRLIVRRDEVAKQTAAGIIVPEATREREAPNSGVVLAIGEGRLCPATMGVVDQHPSGNMTCVKAHVEPLRVKVGDHILFNSYAGTAIVDPTNDEVLLLMQEDDVLAIINPEYLKNASAPKAEQPAEVPAADPAPVEQPAAADGPKLVLVR